MLKYIIIVLVCGIVCSIGVRELNAAWVQDGIAVCTMTGVQDLPVLVSDGYGGAIVVWRDDRVLNTDIYAQRVDADGTLLWPDTARPICTAPNSQSYPKIVSDGEGGAIISWQDPRGGAVPDIYIQRINEDGYAQWQANGVPVCTGQTGLSIGQMISDGSGGAIVCWSDRRYLNFYINVYVQKIDADGAVQWTANGVSVGNIQFTQEYPVLASDGSGGAIVAWQDRRNGAADIYAQRVDATGTLRWGTAGVAVCASAQVQQYPRIISDGSGGAIIAWEDRRNLVDYDIFAQRVDGGGAPQWTANGVGVSATSYNQRSCQIVPVGSGGAIIGWVDYRSGSADIYAQMVDATGARLWTSNGVAVCGAANDQLNLQLIPNGLGGAVATWDDQRAGAGTYDVYAQRIDSDGTPGWTADGLAVCGAGANQQTPQIAPDEWGGASFTWRDERSGNADIYNQKIDAAGDIGTATLLRDFAAHLRGAEIVIEWTLSESGEDVDFIVLRAVEPSTSYYEISSTGVSGSGMSFTFVDRTCDPGSVYRYRVDVVESGERSILFETGPVGMPAMCVTLFQNRPNPFNPSTEIRYYLPEGCIVSLNVYDVEGALVARLVDGHRDEGIHTVSWNGLGGNGREAASGVYFYRLEAAKKSISKKMILVR